LFQRLAVIGAAAHSGLPAEAVDVCAQRLLEVCLRAVDTLPAPAATAEAQPPETLPKCMPWPID
jgi:hypothetical protein